MWQFQISSVLFFSLVIFLFFFSPPIVSAKKSSLPVASKPSRTGSIRNTDKEMKEGRAPIPAGVKLPSAIIPPGQVRQPGTLLLNMLIKNEAEHLERTLPKWAKIIDYWIIGVDDNNTDNSPDIIQKYLGHIPGSIVIVHFDGMGPTWTILVQEGLKKYPEATHGIISDADYMPLNDETNFDKMELDIRCSKHMFTIWTQDHKNERKMDWIYRNIPGVRVKRRTHQILEAPELPGQEVFQTLINLHVEEREGGYGDRSGKKNERYIKWLEKDLEEYPNDTRTIYYLGYAHFDIFSANKDHPSPDHWKHLEESIRYFKWRGDLPEGNAEERWFALLKLGEIYERFYKTWNEAEKFYKKCTDEDPERADAWFYIGQHYRLWGDIDTSIPYLRTAANLPIPERSLFQWLYLYRCLSKLEYARAVSSLSDEKATKAEYKEARDLLKNADCADSDKGEKAEIKSLLQLFDVKLSQKSVGGKNSAKGRGKTVKKLLTHLVKYIDDIEEALQIAEQKEKERKKKAGGNKKKYDDDGEEIEDYDDGEDEDTAFGELLGQMEILQDYYTALKKIDSKGSNGKKQHDHDNDDESDENENDDDRGRRKQQLQSCRTYRKSTTDYLKMIDKYWDTFEFAIDKSIVGPWKKLNTLIKTACR